MSKLTTLEEKFLHDLGDIYDAEHRFLDAQNEMLGQATDRNLKQMIKTHIKQTRGQIERLERGYEALGKKAKRVKCAAAVGLVNEGRSGMKDSEENPKVRDCVIASAASKVEYYEISSYRGLIAAAESMGNDDLLAIFRENLAEEEQTAGLVEQGIPELLQKAGGKRKPSGTRKPPAAKQARSEMATSETDA